MPDNELIRSEVETLHVGTVWWEADDATNKLKRSPEGAAEAAVRTPVTKEPCLLSQWIYPFL